MKNVKLTKFWKTPQEVRIELYDTTNNLIGNKITKTHTFNENENSVTITDNVWYYAKKDFGGGVAVNKIKLYYENELIGMRRFPNISMCLGDSLSITFTLCIEIIKDKYVIEISP